MGAVSGGSVVAMTMLKMKELRANIDELTKKEKMLKIELIKMAEHNKLEYEDIKFYKLAGKKTNQYKQYFEDKGLEIPTDYVKEGKESWTFKVAKPK